MDHADKTWKILEDAIHEINNHNASGLSFEELYRYPSMLIEWATGQLESMGQDIRPGIACGNVFHMGRLTGRCCPAVVCHRRSEGPWTWCRRNAYNMVINKFGDRLYSGLVNTIKSHLSSIADNVEAAQGQSFLQEMKMRWDHHNKSMQMIRDILMVGAGCHVLSAHMTQQILASSHACT